MSLQTAPNNQVTSSNPSSSQPSSVNVIQSSNPKGNQNSKGKKKGRGEKKSQDGKTNANKPGNNVAGGGNDSREKFKFPCKLCSGDHLTHLYPKIQDAQHLLGQQGTSSSQAMLTNPFPQGQQMLASTSSNPSTSAGETKKGINHQMFSWWVPTLMWPHSHIIMVKVKHPRINQFSRLPTHFILSDPLSRLYLGYRKVPLNARLSTLMLG